MPKPKIQSNYIVHMLLESAMSFRNVSAKMKAPIEV